MRLRGFAVLLLVFLLGCGDDDTVSDGGMDATDTRDATDATDAADATTDVADAEQDVAVDSGPPPVTIDFPAAGAISTTAGASSFTFGVATAAAQIEDQNESADWYVWTAPEAEGGVGEGTFVGEAVQGYTRQVDDVALIAEMSLDAYRFNPSWARIEPTRDAVDEDALAHYGEVIDALVAQGIKPMLTVHHFSSPTWVDDPRERESTCPDGVSDTDLCGWHGAGADQIIEELAEHGRLLAERYGDRVDEWCTLNEPVNYLLASYGLTIFPPGRNLMLGNFEAFIATVRNYIRAHVALYRAIKEADTIDADGDGVAAEVGLSLSVAEWLPARRGRVSDDPADIAAAERVEYVYHHLFVEALRQGAFDPDLDGTLDEMQPDWRDSLDWLGVQYYFRAGVTSSPGLVPVLMVTPCFGDFDFGACVAPADPTKFVESMGYEFYEPGIYNVLKDFSERWPDLPLSVTESGIATRTGRRRAEHVVRSLEQIWRAREDGVDVRGYYHWSLMDNFEWAEGYEPAFGLYSVDLTTYERTATEGATLLGDIASARQLSLATRQEYGGAGPMTEEEPHEE